MDQQSDSVVMTKRLERFGSLRAILAAVEADTKELVYQARQHEAKVQTLENQIKGKREEIATLDEQIRRKKIEASGSFNNLRDELTKREQALNKALAVLEVEKRNVAERSAQAEELIRKAERAIGANAAEPVIPAHSAPNEEPNALDTSMVNAEEDAPAAAVPAAPVKRGPGRPKKVAVSA